MTKFTEVIRPVRQGGTEGRTRRTWSTEQKITILDAAFRRGGSVAAAAHRFGVSPPLIYLWRTRVRDGLMPDVVLPDAPDAGDRALSAVAVTPASSAGPQAAPQQTNTPCGSQASCSLQTPCGLRRGGMIEVRLANGRAVTADDSIAPDALARLVAALDGEARLRPDGGVP
jgi:transposase-like protein